MRATFSSNSGGLCFQDESYSVYAPVQRDQANDFSRVLELYDATREFVVVVVVDTIEDVAWRLVSRTSIPAPARLMTQTSFFRFLEAFPSIQSAEALSLWARLHHTFAPHVWVALLCAQSPSFRYVDHAAGTSAARPIDPRVPVTPVSDDARLRWIENACEAQQKEGQTDPFHVLIVMRLDDPRLVALALRYNYRLQIGISSPTPILPPPGRQCFIWCPFVGPGSALCENPCCVSDAATAKTRRCTRCQHAFYCSTECQRAHWSVHKHVCVPAASPPAQNVA